MTKTIKAHRGKAAASPRTASQPAPQAPTLAPGADPSPAGPMGKLGLLTALLGRPQGASIADMMHATGWQAHSVRGALSGALKKKRGLKVNSEKTEAGRVYRIEAGA